MLYKRISKEERFYIEYRLANGDSVPKIAKDLGRNKTSIYREIKKNTDENFGFYSGLRAQNISAERQATKIRKEKFFATADSAVLELIHADLLLRSSPDQITGRLKNELSVKISQQTIYRYIWADKANGGNLTQHLRRRGKPYRNKSIKEERVKNKVSIEKRDSIDLLAQEAGNYEIDTIFGLEQKSFLLTIVDIATKYTIIRKIPNKEAQTVYNELKTLMATTLLPFKSITSDNGCEFGDHAKITEETGIAWYFCNPYSSWERGLHENTNGLIRDFYPKRTDFRNHSDEEFVELQNILNNRPRKTLKYMTPTQAMAKYFMLNG